MPGSSYEPRRYELAKRGMMQVCGRPGAGKSYFMTYDAYKVRRRRPDRRIVANFKIYLPGKPVEYMEYSPAWFELRHCQLYFDEVHRYFRSRDWARAGAEAETWFSQLRKADVDLMWCTQDAMGADKMLRDRTEFTFLLENWLRLGFMWVRLFYGSKIAKDQRCASYPIWFNERIAQLYDTDFRIGEVKG